MTDTQSSDFEKTVIKAEKLAQSNMSLYKLKLMLYALLGYVVIFAIVIALFGLVGGMIGMAFVSTGLFLLLFKKKLIFVLIPTIWVLMKSLWVRLESPSGYLLSRKQFPELYEEIDYLRKTLRAPKIHQVILTPELNAAINQTPRLGICGWNKNSLILGLELLLTLSPEQARAVLAHEFGHLSGNHSRFNNWIYRIRLTWYRIMNAFDHEESIGARIMRRFFDWYAPRFAAYSFALARANEYEADAISAELTSANAAGAALINTHVTGPYIDDHYWSAYFKKADRMAKPDHAPWIGLGSFLSTHQPALEQLTERLQEELKRKTAYDDTHPALQDRISALNASQCMPEPVKATAAEAWLGTQFQRVINDFDNDWINNNEPRWKDRYDYVVDSKKTLLELQRRAELDLTDDELWQKATLTEQFEPNKDAFSIFQTYQSRCPDDPDVAFVLGRMLYDKKDDSFLDQMKKALARPNLVVDACQYAYYYLMDKGRNDEAEWWRGKADAQIAIDRKSEQERSVLNPNDNLDKAAISKECLEYIVEKLKSNHNVKKAWIASKRMEYYPEVPALAIAVVFKGLFVSYDGVTDKVAADLNMDCSLFVVPKAGDYKAIAKNIIKIGDRIL